MSNYLRWNSGFESVVNTAFIADFTRELEKLYLSTHAAVEDLPQSYQRYLRPHQLRTYAEIALIASARNHGVQAATALNHSKDAHAIVTHGPFLITLSSADSPTTPPRPARFRSTYAEYCDLGQFPLPGRDFTLDNEVVAVSDQAHPIYILITHGARKDDWRRVGFIYASLVVPSGTGFRLAVPGIDLLSKFGVLSRPLIEEVPEPEVGIQEEVPEPEVGIRDDDIAGEHAGQGC